MSTPQAPSPRRPGFGRLVLVAAVGAGAVLGVQSLTSGSGHHSAGAVGAQRAGGLAPIVAGTSGRQGTTGRATGAQPAKGVTGAVADAPAVRPVTGPRLVVVIDEPSGAFAQQNRLIREGATVAVAQIDAAGGAAHQGVRLLPESLDGLSPAAVQQRLRAAGPGAVLVLPCDADSEFSLAAGAAPYKTLMLAPCDADAALAQSIPTYWPVGTPGNDEAAGLAGYLQRLDGSTAFVIDTPGLRYTDAMTGYFRAAAQARGIQITGTATVSLAVGEAEVKRAASAIRAARPKPAVVFTALPPPYVNRLAAGLAGDGVQQILFGTSAMDTPLSLTKGAAALENATFGSYGFPSEDAAASNFLTAYRARFGLPVGSFPGLGYETIRLLDAAVTKARSTTPAAIQQALLGGISLPGVALFDRSYGGGSDHSPTTSVSVEKISSGSFLPLVTGPPTDVPKP
jgi:branched-chain amino acid transport system substrate-binding protein